MPLIEVEEGDIIRLKNELASSVASKKVLDGLGKNPKTRMRVLQLMKENDPSLVIPEIDVAAPYAAKISALEKRLDDKDKDHEFTSWLEKGRKGLRDAGYNEDAVKGIEKIMTERGITSHADASAVFDREMDRAEPLIPNGGMGFGGNLFEPPEGNPWAEALKPRGTRAAQDKAIRKVANDEVNKWFAENRPEAYRRRVR